MNIKIEQVGKSWRVDELDEAMKTVTGIHVKTIDEALDWIGERVAEDANRGAQTSHGSD